jgi:hypothetical protein
MKGRHFAAGAVLALGTIVGGTTALSQTQPATQDSLYAGDTSVGRVTNGRAEVGAPGADSALFGSVIVDEQRDSGEDFFVQDSHVPPGLVDIPSLIATCRQHFKGGHYVDQRTLR